MKRASGNTDNNSDFLKYECDKSVWNIYIVSNKSLEQIMSESIYNQLETERKEFRVILEFPNKSDNETVIHEEVRQILSNLLQEQIAKII